MPKIATSDAQALFTKKLIATYLQRPKPTGFLRSFFPTVTTPTLEVALEIYRLGEAVAVDVQRGTNGNRNSFSKATEKIFIPPYFREWFDVTQLQLYDRLYAGSDGGSISDSEFAAFISSVVDKQMVLKEKIERSIELQCASVLEFGTVSYSDGSIVDFKRQAGSLVNGGSSAYFATAGNDPFAQFQAGCDFLRGTGKAMGGTFNAIMGSQALSDLLANTKFNARQNLFNLALDQVTAPQRNAEGATLNGEITVGAYKVRLWAYPQYYDLSGTSTPYVNPKKVTMIPETPNFKLAFAAVPQLIENGKRIVEGDFIFTDVIDQRGRVHLYEVESAPLAMPVAVDQIYTFKAVA